MADKGPWPELLEACLQNSNDKYSQARRWQKGYSDCSSWVGKGMKILGKNPGGSTTLTFLSSRDWVTIPASQRGTGDIAVNSAHMVVISGSNGAVGQQRPGRNVQIGTLKDLMSGTGPYVIRRYKGGSDVQFAGFDGDDMDVQQAGLGSVLKWPGKMVDAFQWMTDTQNWYRIGMVVGGAALIWMTIIGIGKAKVGGLLGSTAQTAGKAATKSVASTAKTLGKKVTKGGGNPTGNGK